SIVTYDMVHQTSLASCEFPKGVNEFIKAGFTEQPATLIKPPMVKESKVKLECKVIEVKPLGTEGGAGNLVICEILRMHIDDSLLHDSLVSTQTPKLIDQRKINHVARLGGDWYCVVNENNLFQVEKPNTQLGIGIDALPENIRSSNILSGNNLGQLANVQELPVIDPSFDDDHLKQIIQYYNLNPDEMEKELHLYAKKLLDEGKVREAWQVLLSMT
ncbi:MAG TPA: hypothetical protein VJU78_08590, partial [Chitinophagaceae bacterium]|nr:hypothetical protein [Chitinophagaceae bacterium]